MKQRLLDAKELVVHFGCRWVAYRALRAWQHKAGWAEWRRPVRSWPEPRLSSHVTDPHLAVPEEYLAYRRSGSIPFFFEPQSRSGYGAWLAQLDAGAQPAEEPGHGSVIAAARRICRGELCYFNRSWFTTGWDWFQDPFTGRRCESERHWSRLDEFAGGDIKVIWEPSRFGFVYTLVRAYWRSGEEAFAETFWRRVEDWRAHNPPEQGANWKCGQEIAFRLMAWCFGLYGFLDAPATTAERVASLAGMIAVSAGRIERHFGYALSQQNNHALSEAVGLRTVGLLFPEFGEAARWREKGRAYLERLARELIYEDGAFCQHSVNYHRLMLHALLWATRLGELHGDPPSPGLRERLGRAGAFLYQLLDLKSGRAPWFGPNDGALILPLSECDYADFRPVVQAASLLATRRRGFGPGPWDEEAAWLLGPAALANKAVAPVQRNLSAPVGGYYTLRSSTGFAAMRCPTFRHRPAHADLLHVDLWLGGVNVALDPGTFSYNPPEDWQPAWEGTACHNTVTVDGQDQMRRVGRFLWLPWACGQVCASRSSAGGRMDYWEAEHDGYTRLADPVWHRRAVLRLGDSAWVIADRLAGRVQHRFRLHWLLADGARETDSGGVVELARQPGSACGWFGGCPQPGPLAIVSADPASGRGWRSEAYYHRQPAASLELNLEGCEAWFYSVFALGRLVVERTASALSLAGDNWRSRIEWAGEPEGGLLVRRVELEADTNESWVLDR